MQPAFRFRSRSATCTSSGRLLGSLWAQHRPGLLRATDIERPVDNGGLGIGRQLEFERCTAVVVGMQTSEMAQCPQSL